MEGHEVFMRLAIKEARLAFEAGDFPVGCVIVQEGKVVATGRRQNSSAGINELDHAEIVALRTLFEGNPQADASLLTVYSTMEPCLMCYATMLVNNISNIVYGYEDAMGGGTNLPLAVLAPLYSSRKVEITGSVLRPECLALFQQFFRAEASDYLQDTLLARYTLSQ